MPKVIIGFQSTKEMKERVIKAAKDFEFNGTPYSLNLSGFCRLATFRLLDEVEKKKSEGEE